MKELTKNGKKGEHELNKLAFQQDRYHDSRMELSILSEVDRVWLIYRHELKGNNKFEASDLRDYIQTIISQQISERLSDVQVAQLLMAIDTNGDGYVDQIEMLQFLQIVANAKVALKVCKREADAA